MTQAWLFPGQGTQKVGMGKELFESSAAARAVFEAADEALGERLSALMFDGPADRLLLTANAQPAILTASLAALAALREAHPELEEPAYAAGHSLGEYTALTAAGSLELADAVRLVRLRGEAMQAAVPPGEGAMAALLGGTAESVRDLCQQASAEAAGSVTPANYNAPGQIVVAGHTDAVGKACELARQVGLKPIPLKVSAPFHSPLMSKAAAALSEAIPQLELRAPRFVVLRNIDARPHESSAGGIANALVDQVCGAVRWQETLEALAEAGVTGALEFGAGRVLAGLMRKTAKSIQVAPVSSPQELAAAVALAEA